MAAGKKTAKSNKTAHVLNLLTAPDAEGETTPAQSAEVPQETPPPAIPVRALTPPILEVARANDEQLSEQIKTALEDAFPPEEPLAEEPRVDSSPIPAESAAEATPPEDALVVEVPEKPAAKEEFPHPRVPSEEEVGYFNVMQALVEEKAPRYVRMFGLCPCRRCATDVKALALNHLEPKYVFMRKSDRIPMLTVYESRYSAAIFAQLTHACKVVMDNPRHEDIDFKPN